MSANAPDLRYHVRNFAAGYLETPDAGKLPLGATPDAANMMFVKIAPDRTAGMARRAGARCLQPACLSVDMPVDGAVEFIREGVADGALLAVCDGGLYEWDNLSTFTLKATGGWTSGVNLTFLTFRNLLFIMDGTNLLFWDGTDLIDPTTLLAPTAAPGLAAVAPAAAGLTGTYQTLAVWYDQTHDHESSPTAPGAATALAAEDREHTKPTGAPPAHITHWRVYCRRTDTNETLFKLVATVPVGTATHQEATTDSARNLAATLRSPAPNVNDAPPAFVLMETAKGYVFGVVADDSYVHVSALGDPVSYHPKDQIGIARGFGGNVRSVRTIGKRIIVQKHKGTWELIGERMPFIPEELSGDFGNHNQNSGVEAEGRYWAWDEEKGPYWTDLVANWVQIAEGRIATLVGRVNPAAHIHCVHYAALNLVCWIVALDTSIRQNTMLAWHTLLHAWLPPITGLNYDCLTTFRPPDSDRGLFIGDAWGRLFQYFVEDAEGVPDGDTTGTITDATSSVLTDAGAAFSTTGDGLKGLPVAVVSASGDWTWRTIQENTATTITIDTVNGEVFDPVPSVGDTIVVGGIDGRWKTALVTGGDPFREKIGRHIMAEVRAVASPFDLRLRGLFNDTVGSASYDTALSLAAGGVWGTGLWGTMTWGVGTKQPVRRRIGRNFYSAQFEFQNGYPNQNWELVEVLMTADWSRGRLVQGG